MVRHLEIKHGQRRLLFRPWRVVCRCGDTRYPCDELVELERQRQLMQAVTRQVPMVKRRRGAEPPLMTLGQLDRSSQGGRW